MGAPKLMAQYGEFVVPSQYDVVPNFVLVIMLVEPKEMVVEEEDGETTMTVVTNKWSACDYLICLHVVACLLTSFGPQLWLHGRDKIEGTDSECLP
jgi:hypothetical protein